MHEIMSRRRNSSVGALAQTVRSNANGVGGAIRAARGRVLRAARAKKWRIDRAKWRKIIENIQQTHTEVEAEVGEFIQSPHLLFQPIRLAITLVIPMIIPLFFMPTRFLLIYPWFVLFWYLTCLLIFATEVAMRPPWHKKGLPTKQRPPYWGRYIHDPQTDFGAHYESVEFKSPIVGTTLRGWFIPALNSTCSSSACSSSSSPSTAIATDTSTTTTITTKTTNTTNFTVTNSTSTTTTNTITTSNNNTSASNLSQSSKHGRMIVFVHGAGQDRRSFLRHSQHFIQHGYSCLLFDFSEHGISDNVTDGVSRGTLFGAREQYDVIAAVEYLKKVKRASEVAIIGTSCGASSAIQAASLRRNNLISCVIAENPFSRADDLLRYHLYNLSKNYLSQNRHQTVRKAIFWLAGKLLMLRMGYCFQSYGAIDAVINLTCPLFILHSTEDDMVPYEQGHAIFEMAKAKAKLHNNEFIQFSSYSNAPHCALYDQDPERWMSEALQFLEKGFERSEKISEMVLTKS